MVKKQDDDEKEHIHDHPDRLPIMLEMFEARDTKFQSLAKIVAEHGMFLKILGIAIGTIATSSVAVIVEYLFNFFRNLK